MKNLLTIISLTLLISCAGETEKSREIENLSDQDIKILFYNFGFPLGDTISVASGEKVQISMGRSNKVEEEVECKPNIDSAFTSVAGGGTIVKNIALEQNWVDNAEQTKILPPKYEHICIFTIRNSDIEN